MDPALTSYESVQTIDRRRLRVYGQGQVRQPEDYGRRYLQPAFQPRCPRPTVTPAPIHKKNLVRGSLFILYDN